MMSRRKTYLKREASRAGGTLHRAESTVRTEPQQQKMLCRWGGRGGRGGGGAVGLRGAVTGSSTNMHTLYGGVLAPIHHPAP